jgi:hypothetical protein
MMRKGWFNDNWKHALAAKGVKTNSYYRRKPALGLRRARFGKLEQPVVYKESVPYQTGTFGSVGKNIRRSEVLASSQKGELLRLEREKAQLERMSANLKKGADADTRKELNAGIRERDVAIAALLDVPVGEGHRVRERVVATSAKRSRIMSLARPGEVSSAQRAGAALSAQQKSALVGVEKRSGMMESGRELLPKGKYGKRTVRELTAKKQERAELARMGRAGAEFEQKAKKYERVEFDEGSDEGGKE